VHDFQTASTSQCHFSRWSIKDQTLNRWALLALACWTVCYVVQSVDFNLNSVVFQHACALGKPAEKRQIRPLPCFQVDHRAKRVDSENCALADVKHVFVERLLG
jgi:hypothetical protein